MPDVEKNECKDCLYCIQKTCRCGISPFAQKEVREDDFCTCWKPNRNKEGN